MTNLFPKAIILLFICASIHSGIKGDWADCGYGLAAAVLNICVYFK